MTGRTIGTPAYMSPESCAGREVTGASDQYALGVVGYELLAGRNPFLADTSVGIMYAHVHESPQPIGELRPDCPPEMAAAIMRMIDKNVAARFPTLKEAAQAIQGNAGLDEMAVVSLGALAASRGSGTDQPTPTPVPRRTPVSTGTMTGMMRKQTTLWLLAATVAILGSIVFGLYYLSGRNRSPATAADSVLTAARVTAVAARARATAAGVAAPLLAAGDSVMSAAELMVDSGKQAEATALFTTAAGLWDSIPVRSAGAPPVGAPAPVTRQPEAEPAITPVPPATDSAQIVSYYRELALGIQSRQLGEVRRLLPNLDRFAEDTWRRLFEDDDVERIEASFQVMNLTRTGDQVYARIQESVVVTKSGRPNPKNRAFFATLTFGPQGWRQIREEKTS
jgi:serine/threonine-protein kinase